MIKSRLTAIIFIGCIAVFLGTLVLLLGHTHALSFWNIPIMKPHFADLRVITHGADSVAMGLDPLINNPGDPWNRRLNYPRIWQGLYSLGIDKSHTTPIGFGFIFLFLYGVVLILPRAKPLTLLLITLTLLSPAVILGMERANIDLFIFFLLALSIVWVRTKPFAADGLILLATFLKLFPVFAASLLLNNGRKPYLYHLIAVCGMALIYFLINFSELQLISSSTPRPLFLSYGMDVLPTRLGTPGSSTSFFLHYGSFVLVGFGLFLILKGNRQPEISEKPTPQTSTLQLDAFRVGASIYIGTFLLGSNWDYRLLFLIFCIPQLSLWLSSKSRYLVWSSAFAISTMIFTLWHLVLVKFLLFMIPQSEWMSLVLLAFWLIDEISNWALLLVLMYLIPQTFPKWVKDALNFFLDLLSKGAFLLSFKPLNSQK